MRSLVLLSLTVMLAGCGRAPAPAPAPAAKTEPPDASGGRRIIRLAADSPKLGRLRVEPAGRKRVPLDEVEAPGRIEVNPNRVSRVMMPVAGRVREVYVKLGDAVKEGQALLAVESPEVSAAVSTYRQAQAAARQAQANLQKAKIDHERVRDLYEGRAIAQKEVVATENALEQAQAALEQAQATQEETKRRVDILGLAPGDYAQRLTVRAPISGKVMDMTVAPGEYRSDTGTPLMTVADLSTVWVASDVPESSIRLITVGERVEIRLSAFPDEVFHARVMRIADTVDPQTRTIRVRAEIENPAGRLRPEMFGRMRHEETFAETVVVPAAAVVEDEGRTLVYVERARGEFEEVTVETGRRGDALVPVLRGLREGDRVVVDGAMLLRGN